MQEEKLIEIIKELNKTFKEGFSEISKKLEEIKKEISNL